MTYVESFNKVWLCPHPWDERTELTRNMTKFYTEGAGHIREEWGFPDTSSNYLKIVMAAKYGTGYYRVVLSGVVSHDTVNVFYIDFGNYATVNVADVTSATSDTSTKTSWLSPPRWSPPGSGVSASPRAGKRRRGGR